MTFDPVAFAAERSNNAAMAANENSRPMAQYALLINGAAASAIIAFLSKDKVDPSVLSSAPWALIAYGIGVVFAALAMFYMTECLDHWNDYWERTARSEPNTTTLPIRELGERFWRRVRGQFGISIGCFIVGSAIMQIFVSLFKSSGQSLPIHFATPPSICRRGK
jgi:hypothetical protein